MAAELPARALAAVLFVQASTNVVDVFSATNSSPWTAESFGGDAKKAQSCWGYVKHGLFVSAFYSLLAAFIARSWWPVLGYLVAASYMTWLYYRALTRAMADGSSAWS
jgi:hypothetical protein